AVPVGVVLWEDDLRDTRGSKLERLLDIGLRDECRARLAHRRPEPGILLWIRLDVVTGAGRLEHGLETALAKPRAGHEGGHFLLFHDLPADELHHVRMVEVEADHLCGPARGPARLDRSRGAVADLEEGHEPGGLTAAGQRFVLAAERREVGSRARAVLEDPGLARPEIHDAAVIDQIVGHGLDETVVDDDTLREVLPDLRLDVVNRLEADRLHADDALIPQGRERLAREALRAGGLELPQLVLGDETDSIPEAPASVGVADRDVVGSPPVLP